MSTSASAAYKHQIFSTILDDRFQNDSLVVRHAQRQDSERRLNILYRCGVRGHAKLAAALEHAFPQLNS